ncbi:peptide chain release factor N(5)-glutamine methyltransferase [Pragia fontium]|uniref:Release factor glutamine methyltransferase n=2 Tax=Pragia fontium TaxID=82985 RepID=A0AAJ4WAE5_9GAMM|nr:peptide chain release factor N(5)-glutamine methyltransferase [Pragia fontium]AKJ42436.1 SAM-dependent methyltransferase [Pragia fontium]SFC77893.1 release factor glutamine methyltransferase [Pragia fontium DSM 5563 = ATCC 49100]SUB82730.1 Release factor glutamine methyltransferase [Pragia fontium]VEJ55632.1 Release factor glutamine methyltransferase [Pragia fontium]GKX61467.1 release factor glutamine methyltransferase [Pragia fontium]
MTFNQWLQQAITKLTGGDSPKRDAEILLGYVTGKTRTFLMAFSETMLTADQVNRLDELLNRRINGEPIAYLVGTREFWSLQLKVSPVTLIPRPDTEKLVELALERLPTIDCDILDLGTGTGAIALALGSERPDCSVTGIDYQAEAISLAQDNADNLNINNVHFMQGDWFEPFNDAYFDMIVSNPPYIDKQDPHLSQGDVRYEPDSALIAAQEGLADLRHIVEHAPEYLKSGGWLLLEHGWTQGEQVRQLFQQRGFELIATHQDYGGNERVTLGRWFDPQA